MLQHAAPGPNPPGSPPVASEGEPYPISDRVQLEVSLLAEADAREASKPAQHETCSLTILVVDDEPDMRAYVKHCLGSLPAQVTEAADGEEALIKARQGGIHLVISDVVMPHLDGLGLYRALQAEAALRHIPMLLITGAMSAEEVKRHAGADGTLTVLEKPFNAHKLHLALERMLRPPPA